MTSDKWIPLLSGRKFEDFTPEEFKLHVRSLYNKKEKPIKEQKPFTFSVNKKGTLVLRVNRSPKWITVDELRVISVETRIEYDVILKKVTKKKSGIAIKDPMQIELPLGLEVNMESLNV